MLKPKDGDLIVVTHGEYNGYIGRLKITPGMQTVGVWFGPLEVRTDPRDIRAIRDGDKVVSP